MNTNVGKAELPKAVTRDIGPFRIAYPENTKAEKSISILNAINLLILGLICLKVLAASFLTEGKNKTNNAVKLANLNHKNALQKLVAL